MTFSHRIVRIDALALEQLFQNHHYRSGDHSRIIVYQKSGQSPRNSYRDRAPGVLALPGAPAPGMKLPDVVGQVGYTTCGGSQ